MQEKLTGSVVKCGHCANIGRMEILATRDDGSRYAEEVNVGDRAIDASYNAGTLVQVLLCEVCSQVTVRRTDYDERFTEDPIEWSVIFPKGTSAVEGLPKAVEAAHAAAQRVRNVDRNAYAVLLRRMLEVVCIDQGAVGNTLAARLKDLAGKGILPLGLIEVADSIRSMGNVGAHAATGDVEEGEVPLLDRLSAAVLEYVYVAPLLVARAREKMAQRGASIDASGGGEQN